VSTISDGTTTLTPDLVIDYAYQRPARTLVHQSIDGNALDVTLRDVGLRTGTLNLFCVDRVLAAQLEALHEEPVVLTLDADDDDVLASMRYVVTGGSLTVTWNADYDKWVVAVPYQEIP
jgi:hypothetical protein